MKSKRILLPNGCSCSTPSVYPKDWKTCGKSALKKNWRIQYYFYDPEFPKPTTPIVVKGMNEYKDLNDRRKVTKAILDDELDALINLGYNPYTKKYEAKEEKPVGSLHPDLDIMTAFRLAHSKLKASKEHLNEIKIAINRFETGAKKLRFTEVKIKDLKRSQFKEVLELLNLTDSVFNKFKAYFSSVFKELIEYECCETNLTRDIQKRTEVRNKREVLELQDLYLILDYLKEYHPNFYRYSCIFFYSAARSKELFSVQRKHVRLEKQEYDVLIKKGKQYIWETKIIIQNAIPFWTEIVQKCKSQKDYLFSFKLEPGETHIDSGQITRRWYDHVKKKIVIKDGVVRFKAELDKENDFEYKSITEDFYCLKYAFLDLLDSLKDTDDMVDEEAPQRMANHKKVRTTNIYTKNKQKRENEKLKLIKV